MVLLSTLFSRLFLPPGLFILLFAAGMLISVRRAKAGRIVAFASAALLYLLSIEPVRDALLLPLENRFKPFGAEAISEYQAIAVLGGGSLACSPEEGGKGSLSPDSLKRLIYGYTIYRQNRVPLFVAGGRKLRVREEEPEAEIARRILLKLGMDPADIVMETESRDTWENASLLKPMFEARGIRRIVLVTSAYHMQRSIAAFRKAGIECIPAPTDYRTDGIRYSLMSFLPGPDSFRDAFLALHEYTGLVYYRLRR